MHPLELAAVLPLVFWLLLLADRSRAWPTTLHLAPAAADPDPRRVVAVVPARDEAALLPQTLPSLLAQQGLALPLLLVDDASTDGTAAVARRLAAEAGAADRLRILTPPPAPDGWSGKVWALAQGVAAAGEPEWLLFTDADVRLRPGAVRALVAQAERGPYDLVSVMARLHAASVWERLLVPPFVFFFQLLYPFRRVADRHSSVAAAAGGCILLRRKALAAAGGLDTIRRAVIDDVALARSIQRGGGRLWLGLDPGIVSLRPYEGLAPLWSMVARSAFVQLRHSWALLAATLLGLAVFFVSPPCLAAAATLTWTAGATHGASLGRAALWAGLAWTLGAAALLPAVRHHRVPAAYAFSLPLAALLFGLMTCASAWRHLRGHGVRWKGRRYA